MEKYLNYTVEELAIDESFINWVKQSNSKDIQFWENYQKEHPSKKSTLAEAKSLVTNIKFKSSSYSKEREDAIWHKIQSSTSNESKAPTVKSRKLFPWLGAAAAVLLALVFVTIGNNSTTLVSTNLAETETIRLPEGSIVDINAGSSIRYKKSNFLKERTLELKGEAFFNVEKGSSFKVITDKGLVEVLGTSFNIFVREDKFDVSCQTGRVAVKANGQETILNANEKVVVRGTQKHLKTVEDVMKRSDWKRGIFHYEATTLDEIIADLERQLNVDVKISKEIAKLKFSGSFNSKDLKTALSEICWPLDLNYEIDGKNVSVFKK